MVKVLFKITTLKLKKYIDISVRGYIIEVNRETWKNRSG